MTISLLIRTKNEESGIGKVLKEIFLQDTKYNFEVIIVDSGSTDKTLDIAKQYKVKILHIPPQKFTYGFSLNYGIQNLPGEIICCLSAHCVPADSYWLNELVKPIIEGNAHATFGRQLPSKGINPFEEVSLNKHFPEHNVIKGRVPFSNANCAFLKKMWVEMRFDEELSSWEDYLWYFLHKDTYIFQYCPKAAVYHTHPFSIKAISRRAYLDGRAFKMIKKKYNIDLLDGICPTLKTKALIFWNDMRNHIKLFKKEGYLSQIFLIPIVRFLAYKAYWNGYKSIK